MSESIHISLPGDWALHTSDGSAACATALCLWTLSSGPIMKLASSVSPLLCVCSGSALVELLDLVGTPRLFFFFWILRIARVCTRCTRYGAVQYYGAVLLLERVLVTRLRASVPSSVFRPDTRQQRERPHARNAQAGPGSLGLPTEYRTST